MMSYNSNSISEYQSAKSRRRMFYKDIEEFLMVPLGVGDKSELMKCLDGRDNLLDPETFMDTVDHLRERNYNVTS